MLPLSQARYPGELVEELDVAGQTHANVSAFDQVVAQQPLVGKLPDSTRLKARTS